MTGKSASASAYDYHYVENPDGPFSRIEVITSVQRPVAEMVEKVRRVEESMQPE